MTLAAHELSDPGRPPLVFVHALGVGTSARYVSDIAPLLRRRVVGVDGAGYGGSPALEPAEYEVASYVPGAGRLRAAIRSAEVVPVVGAGHDLIADAGPQIAGIVADWLDAV